MTFASGPGTRPAWLVLPAALQPSAASSGSASGQPFAGSLSLADALARGLAYNLAVVVRVNNSRQARAEEAIARSVLMPNVTASATDTEQKLNLGALGLHLTPSVPGVSFPDTVGPFNVFDLRARVTQTVFDRSAIQAWRASQARTAAGEFQARDARAVVVLAVGAAYLQVSATEAGLRAAEAQLATATTLLERTIAQRNAGLATPLDVNRAQLQILAARQRISALRAEVATQKIDLARLVGIPPTDQYTLSTAVPFTPAPVLDVADAIVQATRERADLKAAEAQVRAAEHSLGSALAMRLPTAAVSADYGGSRATDASLQRTYAVGAAVRVPLWEGGRARGAIEQASAVLATRRAEFEDLRADVEAGVRKAFLTLQAAASQVDVAHQAEQVNGETLALARQRFEAGVGDNLSVVQAQQALAQADHEHIAAVFAHNLAKLTLARALGLAADGLSSFVAVP